MAADFKSLEKTARMARQNIIKMLARAGSGHPAGSLGLTDILVVLYFAAANLNPRRPDWPERDRIVLSHGHVCPALYAVLSQRGFFSPAKLKTLRRLNSSLQGHPHYGSLAGVENTSGPLGQGVSQAVGMALAGKMDKKSYRVFCLMSDAELNEGQSWEAFLLAAKYRLDNLTVVIDRNRIQLSGPTEKILPLEPLKEKMAAFNWRVWETDGHNFEKLIEVFEKAKKNKDRPSLIIANTVPGKGVKFMENDHRWHGKAPDKKQAGQALAELKTRI